MNILRKDNDEWVGKCITFEVEGARQRDEPRKTRQDVVDEDMIDLYLKLCDAMDHHKWRDMIRGNWRDRNNGSDAV